MTTATIPTQSPPRAVSSVPYTLTPPDILEHDGRTAPIGATVYRALALLARSSNRTIKLVDLHRDIWRVGEINRHNVHGLVFRVNSKLAEVGCTLRCSVEDDIVFLY